MAYTVTLWCVEPIFPGVSVTHYAFQGLCASSDLPHRLFLGIDNQGIHRKCASNILLLSLLSLTLRAEYSE